MSNSQKEKCHHTKISPFHSSNSHYTFCLHCGVIIVKEEMTNTLKFFTKPLNQEKLSSTNPREIALRMKEKTNILPNKDNTISKWYSKNRKKIMMYLQRLTIQMRYSDGTFYTTLYFLDKLLRKKENQEDLVLKKVDYFVIALFLIIAKMNENNIIEPELDQFPSINQTEFLRIKDIKTFELYILNYINYDIIDFSAYDWLSVFLSNGFILEDEIKSMPANTINSIYSYTKKTIAAITSKDVFMLYSPFQIAFSIIKLAREQYALSNSSIEILYDIYQIKQSDYHAAYLAIKESLEKKQKRNPPPKTKNSSPSVFQSSTHSPNLDSIKVIDRYQIECTPMPATRTKYSANDVVKSCFNPLHQASKKVSSTSISTNISEKKSTKSNMSLNKISLVKDEDENKRKKGKQFNTVRMTKQINFEDIKKFKKTKNSFSNNVEHYVQCNTVGNEKSRSKFGGSFIGGSAKATKIKLLGTTETNFLPKRSFVLNTESNHINNVKYKLTSGVISNTQRNNNTMSLQYKLPVISK